MVSMASRDDTLGDGIFQRQIADCQCLSNITCSTKIIDHKQDEELSCVLLSKLGERDKEQQLKTKISGLEENEI